MKIVLLQLNGLTLEALLADERLANLRRLMDVGAYARIASGAPEQSEKVARPFEVWEIISQYILGQGKGAIGVGVPGNSFSSSNQNRWDVARNLLAQQQWHYFHFADAEFEVNETSLREHVGSCNPS